MSGPLVVIDSSVFVGAKNSDEREHADCVRILELAHRRRIQGLVSTISVAEVCAGYYVEGDSDGREGFLDYLRGSNRLSVVPVDLAIADVAASLRARTSLRLPDALIVASALVRRAECVVTHDREFAKARTLVAPASAKELADRMEGA